VTKISVALGLAACCAWLAMTSVQAQDYMHHHHHHHHHHKGHTRPKKMSILSRPVNLKFSEVHNTVQEPVMLPKHVVNQFKDKSMAIVDYVVDIVTIDEDGVESQAPLYDAYNHHYLMGIGSLEDMQKFYKNHKDDPYGGFNDDTKKKPSVHTLKNAMMKYIADLNQANGQDGNGRRKRVAGFGGGSGAEERGTSHFLPYPYGHVVDSPEALMPLLHVINTKNSTDGSYSPLLECPCTPQRTFDFKNGTIDGRRPIPPFQCNKELIEAKNPSCIMELYEGGFRCCEHGVFLLNTDKHSVDSLPESTYYFKFTFYYVEADKDIVPVRPPACCDATGNLTIGGNVEFDVPKCPDGTPEKLCVFEVVTRQYIDLLPKYHTNESDHQDPKAEIDLVYAVGHLHVGGISIDLYNDDTGELLCHSKPSYGYSSQPGDENNYLVGMSPCIFHKPPRLTKDTIVRVVARYDSTVNHHGVMALWLISVAEVSSYPPHHHHAHHHTHPHPHPHRHPHPHLHAGDVAEEDFRVQAF